MGKTGWCGYCHLKKWEQKAAGDDNLLVTVQRSIDDCGWDVYAHPPGVEIPDHVRGGVDSEDLPEVKYWKTWLFDDYERRGCDC